MSKCKVIDFQKYKDQRQLDDAVIEEDTPVRRNLSVDFANRADPDQSLTEFWHGWIRDEDQHQLDDAIIGYGYASTVTDDDLAAFTSTWMEEFEEAQREVREIMEDIQKLVDKPLWPKEPLR